MIKDATWSILESQWPQSINQSVDWIRLVRGECSAQDMVQYEVSGAMKYSEKPNPSGAFVAKEFKDKPTNELQENETNRVWAYSRWWRVCPDADKRYRLEYSDLGQVDEPTFTAYGWDDFNDDGDTPIRMIVPGGNGKWFILKDTCGYTMTNCNGASTSFKRSSPYYGIGYTIGGSWYSNSVIAGNVVASWNGGGDHGVRHYLWDGDNGSAELSRTVRTLADEQGAYQVTRINWSRNLVIAGSIVYDLELKRVYWFSGADKASMTTRPYFHAQFRPICLDALAFVCTGQPGSFDVTIEYGQAADALEDTKKHTIEISETGRRKFRHTWFLDNPVTARVFRIKIENLTGTGISQIEARSQTLPNPESWDDVS